MNERAFWLYAILGTVLVFSAFFGAGVLVGRKAEARELFPKWKSDRAAYAKAISNRESVIRDYQAKEASLTAELETVRAKLTETTGELGKHIQEREADRAKAARQAMLSGRGNKRSVSRDVIIAEIQFQSGVQGLNPQPVVEIVDRESGFDPWAVNPASGAAGLFQRHPPGQIVLGDVPGQVADGVAYIRDKYGTSEAALEFWDRSGWY